MENMSIFDLIFDKEFIDFMVYWKIKKVLILSCIIWEIDAKCFWQEMVLRTLRILWIFGYWNILWNYLEVNYIFWIYLTYELLMWVFPCAIMLVLTLSLWRVITPSLWRWVRLEALTLHDTSKSLSAWVRLGKAKRPHAKEVLQGALSPTAHKRDW